MSLGHSHPQIIKALSEQLKQLVHTSNLYWTENQITLAGKLTENSFADKVFFCNSGAEANEGAFKLARKFAKQHFSPDKNQIVSLNNSFHGRTLAALTATGQPKYHAGFDPLVPGFSYVDINNSDALSKAIGPETAAVILEPVQGEGGVQPVSRDFMNTARKLCDESGALLIFDEVQCGLGRTGKLFAHQHFQVTPDIMTLSKALGNGVPIGAILATDRVADAFQPGDHATTFGGNPLVTAAACAVLEVMTSPGFMEGVSGKAIYFKESLQRVADDLWEGAKVRGLGFLIGIPIGEKGPDIVNACRDRGLLINCVGGTILRFMPPLTVSHGEINEAVEILREAAAAKTF
jgi:predicted acetylornithine/succinylornithine family transaminase